MGKVIPIRFNNKDIENIEEIERIAGIINTYGSTAKTIKFCINLALSTLKNPEKVYFNLEQQDLDFYFKTRTRIEIERKKFETAQKIMQT